MNKKAKKALEIVLVMLVFPILIASVLLYGWISVKIEDYTTRNQIIEYVLVNRDSIDVNNNGRYQGFTYSYRGNITAYVEYGYYYSPNDTYQWCDEPYRDGFRTYGVPDEKTDWCYNEKICDNWYYYEIHDG